MHFIEWMKILEFGLEFHNVFFSIGGIDYNSSLVQSTMNHFTDVDMRHRASLL